MGVKWDERAQAVGRWSWRVGRHHEGKWLARVFETKKPGEVIREIKAGSRSEAKAKGAFAAHKLHRDEINRGAA